MALFHSTMASLATCKTTKVVCLLVTLFALVSSIDNQAGCLKSKMASTKFKDSGSCVLGLAEESDDDIKEESLGNIMEGSHVSKDQPFTSKRPAQAVQKEAPTVDEMLFSVAKLLASAWALWTVSSGLLSGTGPDRNTVVLSPLATRASAGYASGLATTNEELQMHCEAKSMTWHQQIQEDALPRNIVPTHSPQTSQRPPRCVENLKVHFAKSSEVCFFQVDECLDIDDACRNKRKLITKVFDGPSGHKARWYDSGVFDDIDDWEERFDNLADLMGQQRAQMLWSTSWA